jgi:hypothetical protein
VKITPELKAFKRSSLEKIFDRQLQLSGITEPYEIEYKFHPKRKWRLDYYFPRIKLAVEIQGGTWINGGHSRGVGVTADMEKKESLLLMGIWLYEIEGGKNGRVISGHGVKVLQQLIEKLSNQVL